MPKIPSWRKTNTKDHFVFYNANPKGRKSVGDCVCRAITKGVDKPYLEVYDSLYRIGRELCSPPNWEDSYEKYLLSNGFVRCKQPRKNDNTRYTVKEFCKMHKKGRYVLNTTNHLTCVVDGQCYDTWNCSENVVGVYWEKR